MTFEFFKKTGKIKTFESMEEWEEFEKDCCKLPSLDPFINSPLKKSHIKKGIADAIKFDSKWEYAFYLYMKDNGHIVKKNQKEIFFFYINEKGKQGKFYPDFEVDSTFAEVKGQWNKNDLLKQEQCPFVIFYSAPEIEPMIKELNKTRPGWQENYLSF